MKLRDIRNPGWFWAQNELFDVFQPLIGVHGVAVYMAMCRMLGDPKYKHGRLPLREIAEYSGVSKSQVQRTRADLVTLGIVAEMVSGTKSPSTFELLDLKAAAEVPLEELQRRLTHSTAMQRPSCDEPSDPHNASVPEVKAGTEASVPPRDRFNGNRQHSRGFAEKPSVPPRDRSAVPGTNLSHSLGQMDLPSLNSLNARQIQERENARAQGDERVLDLEALAALIVVEHPRNRLRNWTPHDVSPADVQAVIEAARAEAQLVASSAEDAALGILERIRLIAREVPRAQWRFLKPVEAFMRLREYRMAPADLYRHDVRTAPPKPDAAVGMTMAANEAKPAGDPAVTYWRAVRGSRRYEVECPQSIRRLLEQETQHNPAA